ncbi:MAG TPA: insulinase family protein [Vicinamibacterales bacterium]
MAIPPHRAGKRAAGTPIAVVLLVLLVTPSAPAQDLAQPLPLDPAVTTGRLTNGLTYFIRRNARPANRAMLRLAVQAGSVDEADDQRGLAHVLEHMAFNGTARFKPGELVKYLESIGARFGPHVNAYTSYDETVYMLDVPTDREGVLVRGFEALSDFAGGVTLDEKEIDRERGVVIEEWRGRQGAASRMQQPQIEALFGESRYANRLPIGTPEILKGFPAQRLRDFYGDYYRPDRMAVVVVGDIEPAAIEKLVQDYFSPLRAATAAPRTVYPIPPHPETRYVTVSDREAQGSSVSVIYKRPLQPFRTVGDYRRLLVRALVNQMINARFTEIARQPEAPFIRASVGDETLGRTVESFTVSARVDDGAIEKGVAALTQEVARVRQHGFGAAELERAKRSMVATYERAFNERNTSESSGYASELLRHFLTGEPVPGIEAELGLVRRFIPEVTAAEAAALTRELITEDSRVVLATAPDKAGVTAVTEAGLREALRAGAAATVTPWSDEIAGRDLMATRPTPGTVRGRREIPEIDVTVLTMSNGVEVWLKPTDFRNDQVLFTAYSRGGTSLASQADYHNASLSTSLVGLAGLGGFNPVDLGKLTAGKIANAGGYMSGYTHGLSGNATPRDLETALQLTHLLFTAPNKDKDAEAFLLMRRRLENALANQAQNPGSVFGERVRAINTLDHYASRSLKLEDLPKLDPERMQAYFDARFANAADFTFFFVGAFKVDEITPLLTTYIGSLPSRGTATATFVDDRMRFPASVMRETVIKGQEPRSQTVITFFADTGLDEIETHRARAAAQVLQIRLRELLREELGGTYSVGVGYSDNSPQAGYGYTSVQFGSSPENAEKLTKAVLTELERLQRDGPLASDVQVVKETEKNELQTSYKQNGYWLNSLQAMHLLGRDPRRILQRTERADSLTGENVHAALRKYFPLERHTIVTLMPEK